MPARGLEPWEALAETLSSNPDELHAASATGTDSRKYFHQE